MVEIHITDIIPYIGIPEPPNGRRNYNIPCPCCDNEPGEKHRRCGRQTPGVLHTRRQQTHSRLDAGALPAGI